MAVMAGTFKNGWRLATASDMGGRADGSFRQRNELVFVGDVGEAAGLPVLFGLLDPLLAGGNEVPPDMARAFQRIAAEEHHPRRARGLDRDAVAGPEDQQPRALMAFVSDLDLAVDQVDRALFMVGIERQADAFSRRHFGVEPRRYHRHRRRGAERSAGNDARGEAAAIHGPQVGGGVM